MASLLDSVAAISEKGKIDTDMEIAETKREKSRFQLMYDAKLAQLNQKKEDQKLLNLQASSRIKSEKLQENFLQKLIKSGSGPVAIGGNLVDNMNVPSEEGADKFPILTTTGN